MTVRLSARHADDEAASAMSAPDDVIADMSRPANMRAALRFVILHAFEPSFADLQTIPGFTGAERFGVDSLKIVLWENMSPVACTALRDLIGSGEVELMIAHPAVYQGSDAPVPALPLAKRPAAYAQMHWLPTILRLTAAARRAVGG